jgi:hypothetical protein
MTAKDSVRALFARLPKDCSVDQVQYHRRKLRLGLACVLVAVSGCAHGGPTAPDSASASTLATAPTSVVVASGTSAGSSGSISRCCSAIRRGLAIARDDLRRDAQANKRMEPTRL